MMQLPRPAFVLPSIMMTQPKNVKVATTLASHARDKAQTVLLVVKIKVFIGL